MLSLSARIQERIITKGDQSGVYYCDRTCLHLEDVKQDYSIADDNEEGPQYLYLVDSTFQVFLAHCQR